MRSKSRHPDSEADEATIVENDLEMDRSESLMPGGADIELERCDLETVVYNQLDPPFFEADAWGFQPSGEEGVTWQLFQTWPTVDWWNSGVLDPTPILGSNQELTMGDDTDGTARWWT